MKRLGVVKSRPGPRCRALAGSFTENEQGVVTFPEISAAVLERVCQYFYYKLRYQNTYVNHLIITATAAFSCSPAWLTAYACRPTKQIPDFPLPPDQALVLLKAANYLDT